MGTVLDPAITIPDTYADRLLRQTEYQILGPEGAFRSGASVDIFNLAPTRWGKWGKSVIKGSNPNSTWTAGEVGHDVVELDGVDQYIELPHNLMSNRPQGTTMMIFRGPLFGAYRFFSDGNPFPDVNIEQDKPIGKSLAFDTFHGAPGTPNPVESMTVGGTFIADTWIFVGYEWGPGGKKIFVNGAIVAHRPDLVRGTRENPSSGILAIGRWDSPEFPPGPQYANIGVAFFAFWSKQLGEAAHRAIQAARRPAV